MRREHPLNNGWKAMPRPATDFTQVHFDDRDWESVRLPHTNLELPLDNFDPASFHFVTGYRRTLALDASWVGQRVFMVFEAVMARAEVWLDGVLITEHRGGYTPFEVEIPPESLARGSALLAVVADAREDPGIPPFGLVVDYLTYGGIYREVHLEVRPALYLKTLTLETPAAPQHTVRGRVLLSASPTTPLSGTVQVLDRQTGAVLADGLLRWDSGSTEAAYELMAPSADPWELDAPQLYELRVHTEDDHLVRTFGFRQAEFHPEGFFLNGKALKLRGLNRHQCWPVVGYAMPQRAQAADADLLKFTLGCNVVRSSHYPASRHFLDRCDAIGLLVFEELPGWQHIGNAAWKQVALQSIEAMVLRDRHRPSVIIWGVRINESADDDAFYQATNALAHRLDPSRPTGGVRNFGGSHLLEDVYTYNDFVHTGDNRPLESRRKIAKKPVPYLVTEHNGHMFPTKKADPETRRVEHALRHARVHNAAAADPHIAGALGWCMADYATHADFGAGDEICHHGVMDQFRCFKPAGAFYASQRDNAPFGQVASRLAIGEHDGAALKQLWVFTNSAEVRVYLGSRLIGAFTPDHNTFAALAHPPVRVDDLIGDAVESEPGLSRGDAARAKAFLLAYQRKGGMPSLRTLLPMAWVVLKMKWSFTDVYNLYARHLSGWGAGARSYRFEGWSQGKKDWEETLGPTHATRLELAVDTAVLQEGDTWDVVRAQVRLLDSNGNEVWFGATPVTLEVDGPLRLQGPPWRALMGGSTAYWLATTGQGGKALLRARTDRFVSEAVEVEVRGIMAAPAQRTD